MLRTCSLLIHVCFKLLGKSGNKKLMSHQLKKTCYSNTGIVDHLTAWLVLHSPARRRLSVAVDVTSNCSGVEWSSWTVRRSSLAGNCWGRKCRYSTILLIVAAETKTWSENMVKKTGKGQVMYKWYKLRQARARRKKKPPKARLSGTRTKPGPQTWSEGLVWPGRTTRRIYFTMIVNNESPFILWEWLNPGVCNQ